MWILNLSQSQSCQGGEGGGGLSWNATNPWTILCELKECGWSKAFECGLCLRACLFCLWVGGILLWEQDLWPQVLHPSPSKCQWEVDMPERLAPHTEADFKKKPMFWANLRFGFRPSWPFLDSESKRVCIASAYYFLLLWTLPYILILLSLLIANAWKHYIMFINLCYINMFVIATYAIICNYLKPTNQHSKYSKKECWYRATSAENWLVVNLPCIIQPTKYTVFQWYCLYLNIKVRLEHLLPYLEAWGIFPLTWQSYESLILVQLLYGSSHGHNWCQHRQQYWTPHIVAIE
jgi:hypothetical protein